MQNILHCHCPRWSLPWFEPQAGSINNENEGEEKKHTLPLQSRCLSWFPFLVFLESYVFTKMCLIGATIAIDEIVEILHMLGFLVNMCFGCVSELLTCLALAPAKISICSSILNVSQIGIPLVEYTQTQ